MAGERAFATAALLANGKVLVTGGGSGNTFLSSAELYDPATGRWTLTADLNVVRGNHRATLLADGKTLVSGGNGGGSPALTSSELFEGTTTPPQITGASIIKKKLFVQGQGFDDGADILVNDVKQKTANDDQNPTAMLVGKKAGKKIARGETVRLRVRNSDGTDSPEFIFTRPAQ